MRLLGVALSVGAATALDNGLGLTPQMGWNSWNKFGCTISEDLIKDTADALISTGLAAAGYVYVNIDDCWMDMERDAQGRLTAHPQTFPSGMAAMGEYLHNKGLKYGIYSSAGTKTCQGYPASLGKEEIDAQTFADWGVDYLKLDNCNNQNVSGHIRYPAMRDALNKTGRPIFYSICSWGREDVQTWAADVGNSWRTTDDITPDWNQIMKLLDWNEPSWKYAKPGAWNDPDMLEVGNGKLSADENRAHFSLWALMKAPLIIGCDVRGLSQDIVNILSNEEVLAVNQDPLGKQGRRVWANKKKTKEVWVGQLSDGVAVLLFNRGDKTQKVSAKWHHLGLPRHHPMNVRDLWAHKDLGSIDNVLSATLPPHGVAMYKFTPQTPTKIGGVGGETSNSDVGGMGVLSSIGSVAQRLFKMVKESAEGIRLRFRG
eukprot:comp22754_c0_seq1/m.35515 comp22754_c0_seq1/g.35515  ORF comp22754_c0_seq1/g.35515 comp22754_c0_seq1/m.35515 type:complete len:429 (-) comp22754_c0_seq1:79-1365(-)